jgi:hypothetical protein
MLFVAAGAVIGLMVTIGPWSALSGPFDWVLNWVTAAGTEALGALHGLFAGQVDDHGVGPLFAALMAMLAVALPGLIALALALLVDASRVLRRVVSTLLLVAAGSTVLYLPGFEAAAVIVVAAICVPLLALSAGALIRLPLAALTTVLAVRMVPLVYRGELSAVEQAVEVVADAAGFASPLWRPALIGLGLAPFVAAGWRLLGAKS